MKNFYYTYILHSAKDDKKYVGYTKNLKLRFEQHQNGMVNSTKARRPLKLIYFEACLSKADAMKREKYLPRGIKSGILMQRIIPQGKLITEECF